MRAYLPERSLQEMPADEAALWTAWLAAHGIKPCDVLLGDEIRCDDEARTVSFVSIVKADGVWARRRVAVQLEAPALPMPSES